MQRQLIDVLEEQVKKGPKRKNRALHPKNVETEDAHTGNCTRLRSWWSREDTTLMVRAH
jgi:hypothetical protein